MFSPNRSDSIRSTFIGENSTITPSQLACELKKQKETLIAEFSVVMSDSTQETKTCFALMRKTQELKQQVKIHLLLFLTNQRNQGHRQQERLHQHLLHKHLTKYLCFFRTTNSQWCLRFMNCYSCVENLTQQKAPVAHSKQ